MKSNLTFILTTVLTCLVFTSCGSSNFVNDDYQLPSEEIKLSIIPIQGEMQSIADSALTIVYSDSAKRYVLFPIENVHTNIERNKKFGNLINEIVMRDYSSEELDLNPDLQSIVGHDEFDVLKNNVDESDLLLLPIRFNVDTKLNHTFGIARFRLYDLNSGDLIYDVSDNFNVNLGGKAGKRQMTMFLIANSYSYFSDHVLEKLENS